ncbi:MAG TPA: aminoglycoside phosphotransferase family protein [Verrucomicrobiae bacterium]|nr:aminoglycoside phosphotransferase family protein [Verrucomicrobiae bacterium]
MDKPSPFIDNDPKNLLKLISNAFPNLKWQTYEFVNEGWDHRVIILDDETVFRFPAGADYRSGLKLEVQVLDYLDGLTLSINIPNYSFRPPRLTFAGYPKVPGLNLTRQFFSQLSLREVETIGEQLAAFLSTIHNLSVSSSPLNQLPKEPLKDDMLEVSAGVEKYLVSELSKEDLAIVNSVLEEVDKLAKLSLPETFIHNDIYSRHLFWDASTERLGIIDFSDMGIGDPAIDFAELHEYGFEFVRNVYRNYKGPKDDTLLDRAWIYQKWIGVYMMVDHFLSHKTTFAVARETFDRVKKQEEVRTS